MKLRQSGTLTVAANTVWLVVDNLFGLVGGLVTTVIVARHFGPKLLGEYAFVSMLVLLASALAGRSAMALVCRKVLTEAIEKKDIAGVRLVLRQVMTFQLRVAGGAVLFGLVASLLTIRSEYWVVACLGVFSVIPSLMLAVSTGANAAREDYKSNVVASAVANAVNFAGVGLTILLGGGLEGLAGSLLVSRTVDWCIRDWCRSRHYSRLCATFLGQKQSTGAVDMEGTKTNLRSVFTQAVGVELLSLFVLDRSEILVLRAFCSAEQLAFFSVGFSIITQIGGLGRILNIASATSVIRQQIHDPDAAMRTTRALQRVIALFVVPACFGVSALGRPLVSTFYGDQYLPAIRSVEMMGLIGWVGALTQPLRDYALAAGRLDAMVRAMALAGGINVVLSLMLIPIWGALGAVWSNGLSQFGALILISRFLARALPFRPRYDELLRIVAAAAAMAVVVWTMSQFLSSAFSLILGPPVGSLVYVGCLRVLGAVQKEDVARFKTISGRLPGLGRALANRALRYVAT